MNKLFPLLIVPFLAIASCDSEANKQEAATPRYSTQTFTVAGMVVITQITDYETNKVYFYELSDEDGLKLKNTFDLTKCGDTNIPLEDPRGDVEPNKE